MSSSQGFQAVSQEAVVRAEDGLFFFDATRGVYAIDGRGGLSWLWAKLFVALRDSSIPSTYVSGTTLGWLDHRLWVSVPWGGSTVNKRIFVHDPMASNKEQPCWYVYQIADSNPSAAAASAVGPMLEWRPNATTVKLLPIGYSGTQMYQMDHADGAADVVSAAATYTTVNFTSHFQTAWYTAGMPGVRKRWRRPTFIVDADASTTLGLAVYTDYTSLEPKRTSSISVDAAVVGTGATWGSFNWNDGTKWGPSPEGEQDIVRGSGFGNAFAVQLKITGPAASRWGLNAIDMRYIPQRIR